MDQNLALEVMEDRYSGYLNVFMLLHLVFLNF
jgi:hypothetical protein